MRWNDLIGRQVGQYKVIEELGRGGAARVFRAYDEEQLRPVAFKVLPIETDDRLSFMQRFAREADVIRTLDHPNIVQVYDAGETEEFVYLALRLLEGGTLRQRIASRRLSTQEVCQYMVQIAYALHHAHQQGIIHRDVKPSNMLLDTDQPGKILLTDFGTAKILNARGLTKTGATVGTPEYMSPEQAEGQEVDQRSDIYSLGCALYEALAGRPPFVGATSVSVLYQQVHAQPTYIRSYNADAPRELWNVLRTCLAKRPDERYGTAERLAEELLPFAEGLIQPTPAPWPGAVTGRPLLGDIGGTPSRPLRETPAMPPNTLPPPFTPAPSPVIPGMGGQAGAGPIPLYLEGSRAPTSRPTFGARGPKPTLRLPTTTGGSGLLSGQLTPEGRQAVSAFEAQLDAEELQARVQRQVESPPPQRARRTGAPPADIYPTVPTPATGQRAPTSGPYRSPTSGPVRSPTSGPYRSPTSGPMRSPTSGPARSPTSGPYRSPTSGPMRSPTSGPYRSPTSGPYRGATSGPVRSTQRPAAATGGRRAQTSIPVNVGVLRAGIDPFTLGHRTAKRRMPLLLMGMAMAILLAIGVAFGMGGLKLFARQATPTPVTHATPRPTATVAPPTATPTVAKPTATATATAQQLLNQRAARAFRAITLAPYTDNSCANSSMTTQFNGGSPVYVNLCMADATAPGPVTVVVRQNGVIIRTLISYIYPSAGATYSQGHTLSAGSYDMLVTMQINGKQATAADIAFTVR